MQLKKVVSLLMVIAVLLTLTVIPASFSAQTADDVAETGVATNDYNLTSTVQQGNILHAFNWRMSDLVRYAPEIAAAGYSTVQISPIQTTKATANDGSYATDWWSFYQPTDMKIGNALGTAADLKNATTELHKYGIKIIADVVTNHVQNCETKADASKIASQIKNNWLRRNPTSTLTPTSDASRDAMTKNDMGGQLPDIKTENKDYQNYVINNLLVPLVNNGVDGFRFDAAKHIETPDDSNGSDYWPTITNAIKNKNSNAFIYGEVLANAGKFNITSYTKYMSVTDYAYGDTVRGALSSKNASALVNYGYSGSQKKDNVLWVESHDTFCDQKSTSLSKKQQIVGWAAIGARADAPALFFVRPKHEQLDSPGFIKYDELMGAPGAADTWKDPSVVAVNHFKNAFAGQTENVTASGANLFVQRGTTGMVIVNLNASSATINQSCSMTNGTYTDQVTGNKFTVSGGKISGNVGASGVAVVYNKTADNSAPSISLKLDGTTLNGETLNRYTAATATVSVDIGDATSGTIKVNNLSAVNVKSGNTTFKLNSSIAYGKSINITVTATNGKKNVSRTYSIKKKDATETKKVYFDNSTMKWPVVCVYCKTGEAASTQIADYDKYQLTGTTTGVLSYTVPANTNYVKFNEGFIPNTANGDQYGRKHLFHSFTECGGYCGRTMPETVVNYGTANSKANREKGGYKLEGAMILRNLRFEDYGEYPAATLSASDTTLSGSTTPTQPATQKPTTAPPATQKPTSAPVTQKPTSAPVTQRPTHDSSKLVLGDADADSEVTILDASRIQRSLVDLATIDKDHEVCADVDKDKNITVIDATAIQRSIAGIDDGYGIGNYIDGSTPPTPQPTDPPYYDDPTDPPYPDDPTEAPDVPKTSPLPNDFVAVIYCEAFGTDDASRNKEAKFDKQSATLTYDFPDASYVFVRNYDTGVQYATDGWAGFVNPVTLVNQADLTQQFDKMYVPAGTHTLYLIKGTGDTWTLGYTDSGVTPGPGPEDPTYSEDPTSGSGDTYDVYFSTKDWSTVYAYVWTTGGGEKQAWPGVPMEFVENNPYGEKVYKFTIEPQYDNIIYNNGNGAQTVDLKLDGTPNMGYYISGQENGKYTCGTYVYGVG